MKDIEISVVVLTRNREKLLESCINSLFIQSYSNFEIIVVDDSSTDGTNILMSKFCDKDRRIKFVQRDGKGLANGRNYGIKLSKGKIIAFIDDDCRAHPHWLYSGIKSIKEHGADFVRGAAILPDGSYFSRLDKKALHFPTLNIFYKKEVYEKIGAFDDEFVYGAEDRDMGIRAIKAGYKLICNPDAIVFHPFTHGTIFDRIKRLWNTSRYRSENRVLLYKKHKEYREELFLKIFYNKEHFTAIVFYLFVLIEFINSAIFKINFLFLCMSTIFTIVYYFTYFNNFKRLRDLPKRFLSSIFDFIINLILTIYTIKGSIKYRYFLL